MFNSFPLLLPLPACSPACLRPPPSLSYTQGELARETHSRTHAHTRRLHEWEAGANPTRPAEPRLEQGCTTAPGGATQVMHPRLPWPLGLLSAHPSLLSAMPSLISVLPFSELLFPFPHLIFFLEFSQRFSIFLGFLFDPPFSLFSQSFGNFLLPGPYFSLLPPLLFFFCFHPHPRVVC